MKPLLLPLAVCLLSGIALAQDAAFPASAAPPGAFVTPFVRASEVTVALLADTIAPADADRTRAFLTALQQGLRNGGTLRLAVVSGHSVSTAGPFRSPAELRAALRDVPFTEVPIGSEQALQYYGDLAQALTPALTQQNAGYLLMVGSLPPLSATAAPEMAQYSSAWLARTVLGWKQSLLLWNPSGAPVPAWLQDAARLTAGATIENAGDAASEILSPGPAVYVDWQLKAPSKGFQFQTAAATSRPAIALSNPAALTTPARYAELRALTTRGDYEKALAINPADVPALQLATDALERSADPRSAIPQFEQLLELLPADASLWQRLGAIEFNAGDFAKAEPALLHARELGASGAKLSEQLGRMRYEARDFEHAAPLLEESLKLDATQQSLWFLLADCNASLRDERHEADALDHAVALGGPFPEQRARLVRIYLHIDDRASAARAADAGMPFLKEDPDALTTWAGFYEQLSRMDDALACWKRVIAAAPRREQPHAAVASILFDRKQYADALTAAGSGLEVAPKSPRLQFTKVNALERTDRIYEARRALDEFTADSKDLRLLELHAQISDVWGGGAIAWRKYAEALSSLPERKADLDSVLRRGAIVALRERDEENATWFASKAGSAPVKPETKVANRNSAVLIPGGLDALMFIARGHSGIPGERFFVEYCRTLVAHQGFNQKKESEIYQKALLTYFEQLNALLALGKRTGDWSVVTLSLANKNTQKQTENVLNILGWKMHRNKNAVAIQSGEKGGDASKQDLASALAIDQAGMQTAFEAGKTFEIRIPWEPAFLPFSQDLIRSAYPWDKFPGGLPDALARDRDLALLVSGLSALDAETTAQVVAALGIKQLATKYSVDFSLYASSLAVRSGHVVAPGGARADAAWTKLVGASPSDPARFLKNLFDKDDSKLLVYWFVLSQLDSAHQQFITRTEHRLTSFYSLFRESPDVVSGGSGFVRNGSFAEFLRAIPLESGNVAFPGSPEVWMVAKGISKSTANAQKLLRKAHKTVAPDVEDEILLRIAGTRYKNGYERATEVENFVAVVRIDAHRDEPLDEESALLLAQNYAPYSSVYPWFASFRQLTAADFRTFFEWAARMGTLPELDANLTLGLFNSAAEIVRLAASLGALPEQDANTLFRALIKRSGAAGDAAAMSTAALDTVRELIAMAKPASADADRVLQSFVTGDLASVTVEWAGAEHSLDAAKTRATDYLRVLDAQKSPAVKPLLEMDAAARAVASRAGDVQPALASLERNVKLVPAVLPGKDIKLEGHQREDLLRYDPSRAVRLIAELRQKAAKKKPDAADMEKAARQILTALAPQVRLALSGVVYAAYLSPRDSLVADDALLLRKHQFFDLTAMATKKPRFLPASMVPKSTGGGSYFTGGFAGFAHAAGRSATVGTRSGSTDADVYSEQLATLRLTPWSRFRDVHQQLLALKLRMAAEWCIMAGDSAALLNDLGEELSGLLSIGRRRTVLAAVASHDWKTVWTGLTAGDRLSIADRYLARYEKNPWNSPVDAPLRRLANELGDSANELAGTVLLSLNGCDHPHFAQLAPYEEYERHMFPTEMAERVAEFKIYLADVMDRMAMPAAAMAALAEPAMHASFSSIHMADQRDWAAVLRGYAALAPKQIESVMESLR